MYILPTRPCMHVTETVGPSKSYGNWPTFIVPSMAWPARFPTHIHSCPHIGYITMDKLPPGVDLSKIPIVPPPPGEHTNFDIYPLKNISIIIVTLTTALMMFFLTVRIYTKVSEKSGIRFDDCKEPLWS